MTKSKFRRGLEKVLLTTTLATASLLNLNAQEVVTPNSKIYDVVNQGNLHILEGKDSLDYYGSGDVILNDTIDFNDAQAIRNGTESENERADVNGDGIVNNTDADLIDDYTNGIISYLPSHLGNSNMTGEDRVNWLETFQTNIEKSDTVRTNNGITWQCGEYSRNNLANTYGIINFENFSSYYIYENTLGNYSNIPIFMVDSYTYNDVAHRYNGMFEEGLSTIDFENYYYFDSYHADYLDIKPGDIQMIEGPIIFSRFAYSENFLGEKVFGDVKLVSFDMDENYNVTLRGVSPEMLRVNSHLVELELSGLEDKEFNYEHGLIYDNLGEVIYNTNLDLITILNTKGAWGNTDLTGQNFANVSYDFSDQIPLYEDERGQYNYTLRRKGLVDLVQNSIFHKSGGDVIYNLPIKSDSIYQTITVRDLESPTIILESDIVKIKEADFTTPEEAVNYTITDNAEVKSVDYGSVLEESNDIYDRYKVDVTAEDITGNVSFGPSSYVVVEKPTAISSLEEEACGLNKIYPVPTSDMTTFQYSTPTPQKVDFYVTNMVGKIVDKFSMESNAGENSFEYSFKEGSKAKPGAYIVTMSIKTCRSSITIHVK